jgi:pre-mRNA-processing factor SLU7
MRENPQPEKDPRDLPYAGDNFVRKSGDVRKVQALQSFVWEAQQKGNEDVVLEANPSAAQLMFEEYKKKKEQLKDSRKTAVLARYGAESSDMLPQELLLAQSEHYVEYSEDGKVIKGQEKAVPKSKYLEDQKENGHNEVWGSYFDNGKWGYSCCHQTIRHSYCTGEAGKHAAAELARDMQARMLQSQANSTPLALMSQSSQSSSQSNNTSAQAAQDDVRDSKKRKKEDSNSDDSDSDKVKRKARKQAKLEAKIRAKMEARKQLEQTQLSADQPRHDALGEMTDKQMEQYQRSKVHADDPMAKFLGQDD